MSINKLPPFKLQGGLTMNKLNNVTPVVVIAFIISSAISGNERSGTILGMGVSVSPVIKTNNISGPNDYQKRTGFDFCIGHAYDNKNVLFFMVGAVFPNRPEVLGYIGPIYFHYFGPSRNPYYVIGGIGVQCSGWHKGGEMFTPPKFEFGPGMRIGMGYEFVRHIQFDITVGLGKTKHKSNSYTHSQLSLSLRVLTY